MAPHAPEYSHPKSQISGKWKIIHWLCVTVINTGGYNKLFPILDNKTNLYDGARGALRLSRSSGVHGNVSRLTLK